MYNVHRGNTKNQIEKKISKYCKVLHCNVLRSLKVSIKHRSMDSPISIKKMLSHLKPLNVLPMKSYFFNRKRLLGHRVQNKTEVAICPLFVPIFLDQFYLFS